MKSAAVTENGENRAGALTRRLTCWFMRMRLPFCMVAKSAGPPHRTGRGGKRGSSSRRSVLVKQQSPELTAGAVKRRRRKELADGERAEDNPWITSGGWL